MDLYPEVGITGINHKALRDIIRGKQGKGYKGDV